MKRIIMGLIALCLIASLSGCFFALNLPFEDEIEKRDDSKTIPYNGDIEFHSISLTVPERFIRDSTQSNEDMWIFERGFYSEYILISRRDANGEGNEKLESYKAFLLENGSSCETVTFLEMEAILCNYYQEEVFCQEIVFVYDDAVYAVALRGGKEESFSEITDSIKLVDIKDE